MMKKGHKLIGAGVVVFKVLAWLALIVQEGVGLMLLFGGGPEVPIGGVVNVPARVVGLLSCFGGAIYFFLLLVLANVLSLLLDVHEHVTGASHPSG